MSYSRANLFSYLLEQLILHSSFRAFSAINPRFQRQNAAGKCSNMFFGSLICLFWRKVPRYKWFYECESKSYGNVVENVFFQEADVMNFQYTFSHPPNARSPTAFTLWGPAVPGPTYGYYDCRHKQAVNQSENRPSLGFLLSWSCLAKAAGKLPANHVTYYHDFVCSPCQRPIPNGWLPI